MQRYHGKVVGAVVDHIEVFAIGADGDSDRRDARELGAGQGAKGRAHIDCVGHRVGGRVKHRDLVGVLFGNIEFGFVGIERHAVRIARHRDAGDQVPGSG